MYYHGSLTNITIIAKVCDRESMQDSWFENHLVCVSCESLYISHSNPKISASNSLYFGSYNKKYTCFWYTNFDFLMYFHNSLIPSIYILILASGERIRSNLEVELHKMCRRGPGSSVESEKNTWQKWAYLLLRFPVTVLPRIHVICICVSSR